MNIWIPEHIRLFFQNKAYWNKTTVEEEIVKALQHYYDKSNKNQSEE